MNKKLYISRRITGSEGRLDYYLTEKKVEDTIVYGVRVQMVSEYELQSGGMDDISPNRAKVLEFITLMCEMEVMPANAADIVSDLVEDDFFINKTA